MNTIETTQIDTYVQTMLRDRDMVVEDRGRNAAAAINMHVVTEYGLPFDSVFPLDEHTSEQAFWMEDHQSRVHAEALNTIITAGILAQRWLEENHPEPPLDVFEGTMRLIGIHLVPEGEGFPGSYITLDKKDES